ncbi:hypothetical protein ACFOEK_01440 [Litoribrevibacter euphylliae]|uniref:Uncharacterized protein n=1 Tax=Litoribrevibacter euphylliae TaxID=1834034 RepID=A0ABV7H7D4_9GAMM
MNEKSTSWSSWLTLVTLLTCGLVPMVAAFVLYFWPPEDLKLDTIHHGQLLSPPLPVSSSNFMHTATNEPEQSTTNTTDKAGWQLVHIELSAQCSAQQEASHSKQTDLLNIKHQQIISALGREAHRVSQAHLCLNQLPIQGLDNSNYQGIVNPNNQLIMVYHQDVNQRGIYQDLKRLLKYNKLG